MSLIMDVVVDGSAGDCGKGKIVHSLLKNSNYSIVLRGNGSGNAGHTIYHNGKKFITHLIPAGIFYNIKSIIGPGCVLHPRSFLNEIEYLTKEGFDCSCVKISESAHIITNEHIEEDAKDTIIGTTKKGVGPSVKSRYGRTGIKACQIPELREYIIDFHSEIFVKNKNPVILYEGAQGFELDIFLGDYPYVSSSHCTVAGALLNGIPYSSLRKILLCIKAYHTYVGNKKFQPDGEIFNKIREQGCEFGSTTHRARQCNYLNIPSVIKAIEVNAPSVLIVNKMDVLQYLNTWKVIDKGTVLDLVSEENFKAYLRQSFNQVPEVIFSYSPEEI